MRLNKVQKAAVTALEDIKARDITVLDTRTLTAMYDALIIATADSARQTKALARNVADRVRAAGGQVLASEGEEGGEWVLVDCADFVVHIMLPGTRALYNLEELWTAAPPTRAPRATKAPASKTAAAKPAAAAAAKKPAAKRATKATATTKQGAATATAGSAGKSTARSPAAKKPTATPVAKPVTRRRTSSADAVATAAPATGRKSAAKKPAARKPANRKRTS